MDSAWAAGEPHPSEMDRLIEDWFRLFKKQIGAWPPIR
jgi:hypothetical protein